MCLCVVCAAVPPLPGEGEKLKIIQIIETLAYRHAKRRVDLSFDFIVQNPATQPQQLRLLHRGVVEMKLESFHPTTSDERQKLIWKLYEERGRIQYEDGCPDRISFHARDNCFRHVEKPIEVELMRLHEQAGPLNLEKRPDGYENADLVPFTSVVLPMPIPPGPPVAFRVNITIPPPTYDYLVGNGTTSFSVDSSELLLNYIKKLDIPRLAHGDKAWSDLLADLEKDRIIPQAYDIVILTGNGNGNRVKAHPESDGVIRIPPEGPELSDALYWYYTNSSRFFLSLRYLDVPPPPQAVQPQRAELAAR